MTDRKHRAESRLRTQLFRILWLVLVIIAAGRLGAQNRSTAEIVGTVTDRAGALVPDITVTITNITTKTSTRILTNQKGSYDMPFLDPGTYTIEFHGTGFNPVVRQPIVLELDQVARIDAQLTVGSVSQIVTVNGDGPILNTDDSQRGTNFNNNLVADLPTVGRDPSTLATLAPGTSTAQSNISGVDPGRRSVNGSRAFSITATINGGSGVLPNSDNFVTLVPALAAVEEFNVIENNFTAEYDTDTSGLNIVTKGGTNQFHGTLFEYFENNYLNARNFFAKTETPLRYNQPGGAIGGPILRNKLFFFFSYQNRLSPQPPLPSKRFRRVWWRKEILPGRLQSRSASGLPFPNNQIPSSRIHPVEVILLYWPAPNEVGNVNNFYRAAPQDQTTPVYDGKIDYQLNPNNTLTGAAHVYQLTDKHNGSIPGPACYNDSERCGVQVSDSQQWTLSDRWILSSNKIDELRFNFVRQFFNQTTPNQNENLPQTLGLGTVPPITFRFQHQRRYPHFHWRRLAFGRRAKYIFLRG